MALAACAVAASTERVRAAARIETVVIRVYDIAGLDPSLREGAITTAEEILGDAGLDADWRDCSRKPAPILSSCAGVRGRNDLVIRILRGTADVTGDPRATLGYSVIETPSGAGTLATIFIDRIERIARHAGADYASLTGRAIAHEVGHLLLGTNTHGKSGLMRELWTEQELFQNRREDWVFAARERGQLRSAWLQVGAAASRDSR